MVDERTWQQLWDALTPDERRRVAAAIEGERGLDEATARTVQQKCPDQTVAVVWWHDDDMVWGILPAFRRWVDREVDDLEMG